MRLPSGPLLILSSHLDDAVMSCSALLDRGEPADVLMVFTGFPRPPVAGAKDAEAGFLDSDEAMTARHSEARNAFGATQHTLASMGLLASQYLGADRPDRDRRLIQRAISDWSVRNPGGTVAIPAGPSGSGGSRWLFRRNEHDNDPDPGFVRDAALDVLTLLPATKVWLYEQYASSGASTADRAVRGLCVRRQQKVARVALGINRREKARLAGLFRSERVNRAADFGAESLPKAERYWLLVA